MSRLITWSAMPTTQSGTVSRTVTPSVSLDDVVQRLEVLHVHRGDDADPLVEQRDHVLPALGPSGPGDVGVRQLVHDDDLRPPGDDGLDVHLLERHAAVLDAASGEPTSRSRTCASVSARPWVSTKPTTTSTPRPLRAWASVEHPERLPHSGRRADVHLESPALAGPDEVGEGRLGRGRDGRRHAEEATAGADAW